MDVKLLKPLALPVTGILGKGMVLALPCGGAHGLCSESTSALCFWHVGPNSFNKPHKATPVRVALV